MERRMIELLAPAGNYEAFRAAVNAGADAVYLGGKSFGARAYADNFDNAQLLEALQFAHIRGRKVYLAVNTLLKDRELENELYDYIAPLYEAGLDAVIVQDLGVFDFIKKYFAGMDIHASTQMSVTGRYGAGLMKKFGASRVVPARELTLQDIADISENVDIEIECFVHGALCYSYSGQCLFSSMLGDRSGNRGRCAQPCRMMYDKAYPLSLKDICTLSFLPELAGAGVSSFKIEGRMKNSAYVAGVVSVYRRYIDMYMNCADDEYSVSDEDIIRLSDLYNRGGFSEGYYHGEKGRTMVSVARPNHQGTCALETVSSISGQAVLKALVPINDGDIFEIEKDFNYTVKEGCSEGEELTFRLPHGYRIEEGRRLYRIRNNRLIDELTQQYIENDSKTVVNGVVTLSPGAEAKMLVQSKEISVEVSGETVQDAVKRPLAKEGVLAQIERTGCTPYIFGTVDISMQDNVFLQSAKINELRRNALERLTDKILDGYRRKAAQRPEAVCSNGVQHDMYYTPSVNVMLDFASNTMVPECILKSDFVDGIYIEEEAYPDAPSLKAAVDRIHNSGKKAYVAMPYVVKGDTSSRLENAVKGYKAAGADAWLIRNLETAGIFSAHFKEARLILDAGMYAVNRRSKAAYHELLPDIDIETAPYELTQNELADLDITDMELVIYGNIPVMLAENCVKMTRGMCSKRSGSTYITDARKRKFKVVSRCRDCYTVTYSHETVSLFDCMDKVLELSPSSLRIIFADETAEEMKNIINEARNSTDGSFEPDYDDDCPAHGHFDKPVL